MVTIATHLLISTHSSNFVITRRFLSVICQFLFIFKLLTVVLYDFPCRSFNSFYCAVAYMSDVMTLRYSE